MTWITIEEAKQKWCPWAVLPDGSNRGADGKPAAMCLACECSAWTSYVGPAKAHMDGRPKSLFGRCERAMVR
jgi:hypothetical protein